MIHYAKFNGDIHVPACGASTGELTNKKSRVQCKKCRQTKEYRKK